MSPGPFRNCYKHTQLHESTVNFDIAYQYCQSLGPDVHLVAIESAAESNHVGSIITSSGEYFTLVYTYRISKGIV